MILYLNNFLDVKLLDVGGLVYFNVVYGEWYWIVILMFLYFSFEYIFMNMFLLFIFGKIVEVIIGLWRMLIVYFIVGLFGNFVLFLFNMIIILVGVSGVIFGLIGLIFVMMYVLKIFNKKMLG